MRVCVSVSVCFSPAPVRLCLRDYCVLYTKCLRVIWRGWWLRANVNYLYMHGALAQLTDELINNQTPLEDPSTKGKKQQQSRSISKAFSSQMDFLFLRSSYSLTHFISGELPVTFSSRWQNHHPVVQLLLLALMCIFLCCGMSLDLNLDRSYTGTGGRRCKIPSRKS